MDFYLIIKFSNHTYVPSAIWPPWTTIRNIFFQPEYDPNALEYRNL